MHVRHNRGAVCADDERPVKHRQEARVIWAKVAFQSPAGRLIGVRLKDGIIEVAIAGAPAPRWVPAERVLSERQAQRWASYGF